jgi:predicted transcriptional regulator
MGHTGTGTKRREKMTNEKVKPLETKPIRAIMESRGVEAQDVGRLEFLWECGCMTRERRVVEPGRYRYEEYLYTPCERHIGVYAPARA